MSRVSFGYFTRNHSAPDLHARKERARNKNRVGSGKVPYDVVRLIRKMHETPVIFGPWTCAELAELFGLREQHVTQICNYTLYGRVFDE